MHVAAVRKRGYLYRRTQWVHVRVHVKLWWRHLYGGHQRVSDATAVSELRIMRQHIRWLQLRLSPRSVSHFSDWHFTIFYLQLLSYYDNMNLDLDNNRL